MWARLDDEQVVCPNCGTSLRDNYPSLPVNITDANLQFLGEYCIKTMGTVGGDGYKEWVGYRDSDGKYRLDYYENYVGYQEEIHKIYYLDFDLASTIEEIKNKYHLAKENNKDQCQSGGYRLIKIADGEGVIRLVEGFLNGEERLAFEEFKNLFVGLAK